MKNKIQSIEDFEKRFKNQAIPIVQDQYRFAEKVLIRKKTPIYFKASFIAVMLSIFITTSIGAAMHFSGWKFFNSNGKEVFEMKTMTDEESYPHFQYDKLMRKYDSSIVELKTSIPAGEFLYFLAADVYEEIGTTGLTMLTNLDKINEVSQIPNEFKGTIELKDTIKNDYELIEGSILYELPMIDVDFINTLSEKMYHDALDNNSPYSVVEGKLSSEVRNIYLTYRNEDQYQLSITISAANESMITTEDLSGYTKLSVGEIDFLYSLESQMVYFVHEDSVGKKLVRLMANTVRDIPEEKEAAIQELIEIAKSLIQ